MAITSRAALKAQFKTGSVPTAQDYFNLIDSVLVKRDDAFFGKWQPGISYHESDVVIYNNALYSLVPEGAKPCGCDDDDQPDQTDPSGAYCSILPPDQDKTHWQLLELQIEDDDWAIIRAAKDSGELDIMYAKVFGKIGMGTEQPAARVHIHDDRNNGDYLFAPDQSAAPEFIIQQSGEAPRHLSQSVAENKAKFTTDTEGFLFQPAIQPPPVNEEELVKEQTPDTASTPVFITSLQGRAATGIGTVTPEAAVDAQQGPDARVLLAPLKKDAPEIAFLHKGEYNLRTCYVNRLDAASTQFITNAPEGFYFRKGLTDCNNYPIGEESAAETVLSIKPDNKIGKVGIGTETPHTQLEVTDNISGRILVSLEKINPAFSVVNLRPKGGKSNYLTIGADNDFGTLITDSPGGFVFRKGGEYGLHDNEINLNQGDDLLTIRPDGKVGIGVSPRQYELDVFGNARLFTLYLDTDLKKVQDPKPLDNVLNQVMKLNPIRFRWNSKRTSCSDKDEQVGFLPHEVEEVFPEVVKTHDDNTKALAYPNLVAVLTKAIQQQQEQIAALEKRLARLESGNK
ncbi:tail fiber domain-containing protein [uncultured Chitinophaga sp.]|jgi:hypothetical protein|uniref:tail fiber domain-containing protein n=1 Tax=uncultured Chitinophaga sp. TaxID=339340 RepID=UPI002637F872|nr:tail fiber domain-containing protein [uncultured Chitinophaga sp.]